MSDPKHTPEKPKPFLQRIQLKGKNGTVVRATGQIDDGAMRNCISLDRWEKYGHCLDTLSKSGIVISVANAVTVESRGTWTGTVQVGDTGALSRFEVFDCKGAFDVILGKPWLREVRAQHDYVTDKIIIGEEGRQEVISNILDTPTDKTPIPNTNTQEPTHTEQIPQNKTTTKLETHPEEQLAREWTRIASINTPEETLTQKMVYSEIRIKQLRNHLDTLREMAGNVDTTENTDTETTSVKVIGEVTKEEFKIDRGTNTSARVVNTFDETRVQEVLEAVQIGPDLTEEQREQVRSLIRKYTDVFALSLSEVLYVDWYKHKLNVDPSQTFPTRINQRPISEGQKEWFNNILDDMEKSFIIQKVPGDFIKNLSSTNLAPKEAGKTGITRTEVMRQVNRECEKNGLPPFWE
jgi:hypothetical protein